jgi:sugar phosphate isomerase/epimerase
MRISTEIGSIAKYVGEEKAVQLVAEAGFDCFDFSMMRMAQYDRAHACVVENGHPLRGRDYLKFARQVRHVGEEMGITCNQSHAPFPTFCPEIRDLLKRAIECTAEAGGKICVVHPHNLLGAEENAELYCSLLPFAHDCGVKLAAENMWCWDEEEDHAIPAACSDPASFTAHLRAVNDPYLVACLDIGHAEMRGLGTSAPEMIRALGGDLQALHLHDNDLKHDSHMIPYSMQIDFDAILRALADVDYKGDFTLEADQYTARFQGQELPLHVGELAAAARRLATRYDELRAERMNRGR